MRKTDNPFFGHIKKVTNGNILIGGDQQKWVQNTQENPDFVPEKNNVGEHIGEGKCILYNENTGRHYLQYEWFEEVQPKSEYIFKGDPIEKQLFSDYMNSYTPNKYEVNIQSVMMNNIKEITFNHVRYVVTELLPDTPKIKEKTPSKKQRFHEILEEVRGNK